MTMDQPCLTYRNSQLERPLFRPDTKRNHEDLGLHLGMRLGMRLCRTTRPALKSSPAASAAVATASSKARPG